MTELFDLGAALQRRPPGYFTIWTAWTPLAVLRAGSMREARAAVASDDLLRELRRATIVGKPLLEYGAKVWVGLASEEERATYDAAKSTVWMEGIELVWLQWVDM